MQQRSLTSGFLNGCYIDGSGLNITVGAGRLIILGREIRLNSAVTIPVTASNNYVRLKIRIDLSQSAAQQVALDVDYASDVTSFPSMTREFINGDGTVYEEALAIFSIQNGAIYQKSWSIRRAHSHGEATQVTIDPTQWAGNTAVYWDKMAESGDDVICTPDPSCRQAWIDAGVYLDHLTVGNLHFRCSTVPSVALTANLLWL
jgi:hypothetical protein